MSWIQRIIIVASIVLGLAASYTYWNILNPQERVQAKDIESNYYLPPERIPNCVSIEGCEVRTRLPTWLGDHLSDVEEDRKTIADETNHIVMISIINGMLVGLFCFLLLSGLRIAFNALPKSGKNSIRIPV